MRLDDIIETLRALEHMKDGSYVCPLCSAPLITGSSPFDGWLMPQRYSCTRCGYSGCLALKQDNFVDLTVSRSDIQS